MKRKGSLSGRTLCKKAATVVMCAVLMLTAGIQTTGIQTVKASTLDQQIEEAQSELEQVKKDQSEVMTVYDQGSIGFVDWMLAKSNLTTKQKYDLNRAKTVRQRHVRKISPSGREEIIQVFRNREITRLLLPEIRKTPYRLKTQRRHLRY